MFEIRVKQGHPTGTRTRDGKTFSVNGAVQLEEVSDAIKIDPWLVVSEFDPSRVPGPGESPRVIEDPAPLLKLLGAANVAGAVGDLEFFIQGERARQDTLTQLQTDLRARDDKIADLQTAALSHGNTIQTLETQVKERDDKIADMEKAAADGEGKGKGKGRS